MVSAGALDRLPFRLHDFTRHMWVSDRAKAVWQPRVVRINQAWLEVERQSVRAGLRPCALQHVSPGQLPAFVSECARHGLLALPLAIEGQAFRVAIGQEARVLELKSAWESGHQADIARLLGYPACCADFFSRVWIDERSIDTTWAMAGNTCSATAPRVVELEGPPQANILLRWLGVRAVPHLPCSFDCAETVRLADSFLDVARRSGFDAEAEWTIEILSWPVEWSALHGIAEIKTPIVKITTRTDATAAKHVVRRLGQSYPAEGARGLAFPFQSSAQPRLVGARSPLDAPVHPLAVLRRREDWYAADNGFASASAMAAAHRPIVDLVTEHFAGRDGTVLDLGCGNGALIEALCARNPRLMPRGVDVDPRKIDHARAVLPRFASNFFAGDMFDTTAPWTQGRVDLAILMPGRLLDVDAGRSEFLRQWMRTTGAVVLAYAYDDWIARHGNLESLCVRAGLRISSATRQWAALATM